MPGSGLGELNQDKELNGTWDMGCSQNSGPLLAIDYIKAPTMGP